MYIAVKHMSMLVWITGVLRYTINNVYYHYMAKNIAKFIGFRLYPEQVALLARVAKKLGISESEVVRRALEEYVSGK